MCSHCLFPVVLTSLEPISYPEPAIFRRRIESSGIIHNRKPEILAFLLDCYIPFCINNQSGSPRFMDYPRALDSSPEDRGLGVRDWSGTSCYHLVTRLMTVTDLLQVVPTRLIQAVRNKLLRACCHQLVNNFYMQTISKRKFCFFFTERLRLKIQIRNTI